MYFTPKFKFRVTVGIEAVLASASACRSTEDVNNLKKININYKDKYI